ncbi:uncharacterized protein AMSG_01512 [Thecamonas trahens ATCC 50062]|uniref:Uncharacterized protein n=1 Tax=Thecamonas trahens ATCC 50062 TaxID=461836 RepID=A0A0L0DRM8_THETB|nr:hypothetical protein AMSG_01512 [Thecamonas trahens ATCC 50062]KNC54661.1 hypothetical protein AMSG_01512 [Thecamonas trahens ATCC 50062]|eukprot:XP_013761563.1 hypothetical protein AMSG_01512 [Thecamonas trahens ATCC 50062]
MSVRDMYISQYTAEHSEANAEPNVPNVLRQPKAVSAHRGTPSQVAWPERHPSAALRLASIRGLEAQTSYGDGFGSITGGDAKTADKTDGGRAVPDNVVVVPSGYSANNANTMASHALGYGGDGERWQQSSRLASAGVEALDYGASATRSGRVAPDIVKTASGFTINCPPPAVSAGQGTTQPTGVSVYTASFDGEATKDAIADAAARPVPLVNFVEDSSFARSITTQPPFVQGVEWASTSRSADALAAAARARRSTTELAAQAAVESLRARPTSSKQRAARVTARLLGVQTRIMPHSPGASLATAGETEYGEHYVDVNSEFPAASPNAYAAAHVASMG